MEQPVKWSEESWRQFFFQMAEHASTRSKDPDRQVGAVLVTPDRRQLSFGYNGFPSDVPDLPSKLQDRELKRRKMRHAEHNCLEQAPFPARGCSLYVTRFPCLECALKIRDAGVAMVTAPPPDFRHPRWGNSWAMGSAVLVLAGVKLVYV